MCLPGKGAAVFRDNRQFISSINHGICNLGNTYIQAIKFDKIASIINDSINCHDQAFRNTDDTTMCPDLVAIMCGLGHVIHITIN